MELLISCPLCSQPGFSDVNSLWLNLIRAATSQLNCPVCEEVLCGLDKLTIHLMSHSLRDQISSTCVPSNASFSSATSLRGLDSHIPHESAMVSPPVHQQPMKENSSIASYVVINFPPIRSVSMETSSQFLPSEFPNATQNEEPINVSSSLKPEHSVLSAVKAEASNNFPARTMISQPPNLASTLPGNEDSDTPSSFKVRDGCTIGEKLHSKESKQRVHKELKNHETSLSNAFSESESNEKFTCRTLKSGPTIRCQMCGLTLKDNNIALLHYQLVHNCSPYNDSEYQLPPTKNDEKETSFKQFPSRCKRESMASQSRDAANPLHRFPCHICNKVFRMRGSLMVHLRVAHTPSGTAGLTSRLENSCHSLTPKTKDDVSCKLSLQNLSLRDTNTTAAIGKELDIFGDVGKINDQTQLGKNNSMVILEPSCSPVDDQTCSFVHQSGKKAIKPCSNKKSSSSAVNAPSPINSSLAVSATPMESLGVIFPCAHCNKTFAKEVLLTQHIKSHESKQWECDVCLKSFTTKYFLKKHKRLHTGEMPYTCGICSKSFTFQQSYHKHLLYHSDEKPHSCAECGRAFKELSTLHNHQRIHTGEKPWACETCDIAPVCA